MRALDRQTVIVSVKVAVDTGRDARPAQQVERNRAINHLRSPDQAINTECNCNHDHENSEI